MWNSSLQHTAITRRDANLSACAQTCIDDSLGQYPCNSACGLLCVCEDIAAWPPITTCLLASCPTTDVASFRLAMSSCAVYIAGCPQGTSTAAVTFPMQGGSTPGTSASIGVTTTAATPAPTKTTSEVNQWSSPTDWRTSPPTPSSVSSTAINASTDMVLTITSAPTLPSTTILTSASLYSSPVILSSSLPPHSARRSYSPCCSLSTYMSTGTIANSTPKA
ncbi:hypothetical protein GY45DRAFT_206321 [Cubamyces sp. BRFM 1775]|nr:hypothetical protein GY45DRAFT_206321 [Cubamyces sp. BRFM 1775]